MKAKLLCKTGILSGKAIEFGDSATIGKSAENDLEINAPFISNQHARIYFDKKENCYFLEDLGSRNGTKLDGMKITQKEKLGDLHVVTFPGTPQSFDFIFQAIAGETPQRATEKKPDAFHKPEDQMTGEQLNARTGSGAPSTQDEKDRFFAPATGRTIIDQEAIAFPNVTDLDRLSGVSRADNQEQGTGKTIPDDAPLALPEFRSEKSIGEPTFILEAKVVGKGKQTFTLRDGENLIGRTQQCPIWIDDPSLSRQHAMITIKSGKAMLRDLESKNHTYLDKKRITSEVEVRPEMKIQFGTVEAVFRKA